MSFPYYKATIAESKPQTPHDLPVINFEKRTNPAGYLPDPGLVDAVNVALMLGQPLLLTGEPGTGKTLLATSLAWQLGLGKPLKFETKSNSLARDLFYSFDSISRFHVAQTGEGSGRNVDYLTFNALGMAILLTNPAESVADVMPKGFKHDGPRRSVVLIDEIDKAPRDFPNDILNELEEMYFRIPEAGNRMIKTDQQFRPILVLTSNSEKHLPDPFLRRCVFYHIPFPDNERLQQIIASRIGALSQHQQFINDALSFFAKLREPAGGLRKKPATSELLAWLETLQKLAGDVENPLRQKSALVPTSLSALIKTHEDQDKAQGILQRWQQSPGQ